MLKRIDVKHLTLGMYLHEFCGSWMEHPFWRTKFVLSDPNDLALIRATAIREVWIDISRGKDVARGTTSQTREEVEARVQRALAYTPPPGAASLEVHNDGALSDAGQRLLRALENLPGWPRRSGKLSPIVSILSSTP